MPILLDGVMLSEKIRSRVAEEISSLCPKIQRPPHLVILATHPDVASSIYVKNKCTACKEVNITVTLRDEPIETTDELIEKISLYNLLDDVDGILLQTPVHPNIDLAAALRILEPSKDVDGATPENLGKLLLSDRTGFVPCTPLGIQRFFIEYDIPLEGKHVLIVGRSTIVGKPLSVLLSQKGRFANATVTLAHSQTKHLAHLCKEAQVIIAATGIPHLITKAHVKEGTVVIDVGISRQIREGKKILVGDVDFASVAHLCSAISPVPGGVGPMTIASLLVNVLKSYIRKFDAYL